MAKFPIVDLTAPIPDEPATDELQAVAPTLREQPELPGMEADGWTEADVYRWWIGQAKATAGPIAAKAAQYGSNSLAQMGRLWARAQGREVDNAEALELGCMLYTYGKMERWIDAALRGDKPSIDTLHDIAVYATMAQRVRETGSWP
jgi:hypothetical protein